jgi:hypothetical protein
MKEHELGRKREECFYFDAHRSFKRAQYLTHVVVERLPNVRLLAWGEAFKEANDVWLVQLGTKLRRALMELTEEELGENGKQIKETDPRSWINQFVVLQGMMCDERRDELHFDGGASLFHMGLTLYGRRRMDVTLADPEDNPSFVFTPGNVYAGNLCAAEHIVIHESDHDRSEGFEVEGRSVKITAMMRTSLFGAGYGRTIKTPPSPKLVYAAVNPVVAQHLKDNCLKLPSFEACLAAEEAINTGCKQLVAKHVRTGSKKAGDPA